MNELLNKSVVNSSELIALLELREKGEADFILVDVREQMEHDRRHIKGVDMLKPTSLFQSWGEAFLNENRDKTVIFTCRTDYRSGNIQRAFQENGMKNVLNHSGGIVSYRGEISKA
ncbi:rhodanese-like domain-containing protein [Sulfurovum sp. bin170]|uniref:rhodanese-like domain-containing protein n=1 Tax=Sulfurovum sp. bin170 TaxID=2695268 RepID=UPI0013E008F2|nr:rhodanese-like domain-containing protein [Sulfurovum sp. bin170]NEW60411.1 rhodanese-like domain-containing protein [Sulfurovum sp. bin170]